MSTESKHVRSTLVGGDIAQRYVEFEPAPTPLTLGSKWVLSPAAEFDALVEALNSAGDLLEAATELEGWISRVLVHSYTDRKPMPENLEVALTKIRAAIAKAQQGAGQ